MTTAEQIKELHSRVSALEKCLHIEEKRKEVAEKEAVSQSPGFWDDPKKAEAFMKALNSVKSWVTSYDKTLSAVDDLDVLQEFSTEEDSAELDSGYATALSLVEDLELKNMLGAEGDNLGAVLTINSGAGGTEANDWSAMLMRMYLRWGERNGYKMTITENLEGDEVGIKSATISLLVCGKLNNLISLNYD